MSDSIACIAYENGRLFIAKRQNQGDMANRWEFPGGKMEAGEDFKRSIKREMREEFGVRTRVIEKITSAEFFHKEKKCTLTAFRVKFSRDGIKKPFVLTEHTEYQWIEPEKIPELDFVDSDLKIYPAVMSYLGLV